MIKLQNLTPEIYYKQSRDFQLIGRLFDIVLNYVKTNADNLYSLPIGNDMNENLLNLLSYTLVLKQVETIIQNSYLPYVVYFLKLWDIKEVYSQLLLQ